MSPENKTLVKSTWAMVVPIADVAARLGRSPDAVKQLQRRAVQELRRLLSKEAR